MCGQRPFFLPQFSSPHRSVRDKDFLRPLTYVALGHTKVPVRASNQLFAPTVDLESIYLLAGTTYLRKPANLRQHQRRQELRHQAESEFAVFRNSQIVEQREIYSLAKKLLENPYPQNVYQLPKLLLSNLFPAISGL